MQNLSTKSDKKISEFTTQEFWNLSIDRYRISKRVRKLVPRNEDNSFDFDGFAKSLSFDRHYVYQVVAMNLYPCPEFIEEIERLENETL